MELENPPAFPQPEWAFKGGDGREGMTLRDWFAGQAPVTISDAAEVCGWSGEFPINMNCDAERATLWVVMTMLRYDYADAMLAARKGGSHD